MLSKKPMMRLFFSFTCLFNRIHAQRQPPKKKEKKKSSIGCIDTECKLKEQNEYCAETMHDKIKCITSIGLVNQRKKGKKYK